MDARQLIVGTRYLACALALAWAGFWVYFAVATMLSEGTPPPRVVLLVAVLGVLFVTSAGLSWRYALPSGIGLLLEGAALLILCSTFFHRSGFLIMTLAAPPLMAGLLLLLWWKWAG